MGSKVIKMVIHMVSHLGKTPMMFEYFIPVCWDISDDMMAVLLFFLGETYPQSQCCFPFIFIFIFRVIFG